MNIPRKIQWTFLAVMSLGLSIARAGESPAVQKPGARSPEDAVLAFHEVRAAARPEDADGWRLLADALVRRAEATGDAADYDRAWQVLDRSESLDPGDIRILRARAKLLLSRHRFGPARRLAEEQFERAPDDVELIAVAGDGALETGNLDAAEVHYRRLFQLTPLLSSWAQLAVLGEIELRRGRVSGGARALRSRLARKS